MQKPFLQFFKQRAFNTIISNLSVKIHINIPGQVTQVIKKPLKKLTVSPNETTLKIVFRFFFHFQSATLKSFEFHRKLIFKSINWICYVTLQ